MKRVFFANDEIYHVFNRSIEQKPVFTSTKEYQRAVFTFDYYRFKNPSLKLSKALVLEQGKRKEFFCHLKRETKKLVEVLCYCLMPNHFHFLLKQKLNDGISRFISNFTNSYTRYFNTKRRRIGPIFQGVFKAVHIENDEQLVHVSRYIHINPAVSFLVKEELLGNYSWSSLPEYLGNPREQICEKDAVLGLFSSLDKYQRFIHDQIDYGRRLEAIKHLILE